MSENQQRLISTVGPSRDLSTYGDAAMYGRVLEAYLIGKEERHQRRVETTRANFGLTQIRVGSPTICLACHVAFANTYFGSGVLNICERYIHVCIKQ